MENPSSPSRGNGPHSPNGPELARVAVVGTAGAGKTTFARALASIMGAPHIELDTIFWLPEWTPRERDEFRALTEEAVSGDTWVVDGNYGVVRDITWSRATAVIWLNYAFPLVLGRALKRTVTRIARREQLFSGNRDTFRQAFLSRDSLLWWVITTYARRRRQYRALRDESVFPQITWIEFQRPGQARAFLESLRSTAT